MISTLTKVNTEVLTELKAEMDLRRTEEVFLLFGLGSQTDGKIKMNLDRLNVYCVMGDPASLTAADVKRLKPKGIILSGGPVSVHIDPPPFDQAIFDLGIPVLGICLGFQLWAQHKGALVAKATLAEYGRHELEFDDDTPLFAGMVSPTMVVQSHSDIIQAFDGLEVWGKTVNSPVAAGHFEHLYGVQFHPEVHDTPHGMEMFSNFCFGICQAQDRFPAASETARKVEAVRKVASGKTVLLALSGGNDSNVTAAILRAADCKITGVYIKGCDRADDEEFVLRHYGHAGWIDLKVVDATDALLGELKGKTEFKDKRLAMRAVYKPILEAEAEAINADFIVQGTLYTDLSESGREFKLGEIVVEAGAVVSAVVKKATIKLHHNTGLGFSRAELIPLADCVKDTARAIGRELGVAEELLMRHPFPGPGLLVRIIGEVTADRLRIARQADGIMVAELRSAELYDFVWQAGTVLTDTKVTYSKGDGSGIGYELVMWAVHSIDGFTATSARFDWDWLEQLSQRMTNEIPEIGAFTYRVGNKPPTTIEFG